MTALCGTLGGYQHHLRCGEEPCQKCLDANAKYMREYRAAHYGQQRTRLTWWRRTRQTALNQLAREYPERFGQLLEEARREHPWQDGELT
jgi:hypothetical protein